MKQDDARACYLVLEDGTVLQGTGFGAQKPVDGEIGEFLLFFMFFPVGTTRLSLRVAAEPSTRGAPKFHLICISIIIVPSQCVRSIVGRLLLMTYHQKSLGSSQRTYNLGI